MNKITVGAGASPISDFSHTNTHHGMVLPSTGTTSILIPLNLPHSKGYLEPCSPPGFPQVLSHTQDVLADDTTCSILSFIVFPIVFNSFLKSYWTSPAHHCQSGRRHTINLLPVPQG